MNKYTIIGISGLILVLSFIAVYSMGMPFTGSGCVEITESMSIKKAKSIAEACNDEVDNLKEKYDELSSQQILLNKQADEKRAIINSSPVKIELDAEKKK